MDLRPGLSALVTGGANGIGKAISLALAKKGLFITIVDLAEVKGKETVLLLEEENKKFHEGLKFPSAMFIKCDVSNHGDISAAFQKHLQMYGGLDTCINSAGIATTNSFYEDKTDGQDTWRKTMNINLIALIDCTHLAIQAMEAKGRPGVIINLGSSSGLYPAYPDPIYSAAKGGVVMFTRSLAPYKRKGIRVNVLCPEFVETDMAAKVDADFIKLSGGFLPMETIVNGAFELITKEGIAGKCLWITPRKGMEYWPTPEEERKYLIDGIKSGRKNPSKYNSNL